MTAVNKHIDGFPRDMNELYKQLASCGAQRWLEQLGVELPTSAKFKSFASGKEYWANYIPSPATEDDYSAIHKYIVVLRRPDWLNGAIGITDPFRCTMLFIGGKDTHTTVHVDYSSPRNIMLLGTLLFDYLVA